MPWTLPDAGLKQQGGGSPALWFCLHDLWPQPQGEEVLGALPALPVPPARGVQRLSPKVRLKWGWEAGVTPQRVWRGTQRAAREAAHLWFGDRPGLGPRCREPERLWLQTPCFLICCSVGKSQRP